MQTNETIRMYASYIETRKAISYTLMYHVERQIFSVYIRGLSVDLRTGEEVDSERFPDGERAFLYTNKISVLTYYSSYEKAKVYFDALVRNDMEDITGYPDKLIEQYNDKGMELRPDWFCINTGLEQEEKSYGQEGFSQN